jgi:hypothetical protein
VRPVPRASTILRLAAAHVQLGRPPRVASVR